MLKFIVILTGCSLALAVSVQAAQQEGPNKKPAQKPKTVQKHQVAPKQHTAPTIHAQTVHPRQTTNPVHTKVNTNANKQVHTNASNKVDTNANANVNTKVKTKANTNVSKNQVNTPPTVQSNKLPAVQSNKLPAVQSNKSPAVNKQIVQKFHAEHPNFRAQPNTAITSARFNPNYRIQAAQNWNGTQYNAFRSYQPQWHDRGWWGSHHHNLSLIGGGWYYWNDGYWYPAWGYDDSAAYYPYDGPIYVGRHARPFDQVVADVQSVLQEQGYYHGEVDGLVGPLTQEALAAYQSAQGLPPTAAVDEPTLESLGLG